jgi:photosystem II stability/assembly factor-like uncharacterized protein
VLPPQRATGAIYVSTSWGLGWTKTSAPILAWNSIACSTDATKLLAAADEGIYTSADSGDTWKSANAPTNLTWRCVASSADGRKLFAAANEGVYLSADSGARWTFSRAPTNMIRFSVSAVASSADGTKLYVAFSGGGIYVVQEPKPITALSLDHNQ